MAKAKGQQKVELKAEKRQVTGRAVKHLRAVGVLPAVLYGKGQASVALSVQAKDFDRVFKQAGESTLVYVTAGSETFPTLIKDVARNPLTGLAMHADFYKVRLDEKIKAMVAVVFTGESPAVRDLKAIFVRNVNELEVEALPTDLPHEVTVDITGLKEFGDAVRVKDIKIHGAEIIANPEDILANVQEPISEEALAAELAEPTTDVSAVEEIKPEKPAEVVEGEEAPAAAPAPAEEAKK